MVIHQLQSVDSTHHYCQFLNLNEVEELTVYTAFEQTAGVGQRGNHWEAQPGQNLTLSFILHPTFLPANRQYHLTETISVAIADWLHKQLHGQSIYIKWPNDIYVDHCKICGTLISATILHGHLAHIIGSIGLNVNQTLFPEWVPRPTSMRRLSGQHYDVTQCTISLMTTIAHYYEQLRQGHYNAIHRTYLSQLLFRNEQHSYRYRGHLIHATILDVNGYGHLQLVTDQQEALSCQLKEIEYLF